MAWLRGSVGELLVQRNAVAQRHRGGTAGGGEEGAVVLDRGGSPGQRGPEGRSVSAAAER